MTINDPMEFVARVWLTLLAPLPSKYPLPEHHLHMNCKHSPRNIQTFKPPPPIEGGHLKPLEIP